MFVVVVNSYTYQSNGMAMGSSLNRFQLSRMLSSKELLLGISLECSKSLLFLVSLCIAVTVKRIKKLIKYLLCKRRELRKCRNA